jgi:hypothetical protein
MIRIQNHLKTAIFYFNRKLYFKLPPLIEVFRIIFINFNNLIKSNYNHIKKYSIFSRFWVKIKLENYIK